MRIRQIAFVLVVIGAGTAAYFTRDRWLPMLSPPVAGPHEPEAPHAHDEPSGVLTLSDEARKNLGLVVEPLKLQTYWRTIDVPGIIVDRPGRSDRGITSPAVGVVTAVHAFPGDTVRPGDRLFTVKVFSEYLQNSQAELFKATQETVLLKEQHDRLEGPAKSGAIPKSQLIEVANQLKRQAASIQAHRQDLLTRGFSPAQIDEVAEGKFVSNIDLFAPPPIGTMDGAEPSELVDQQTNGPTYEIQELKVDLGQQVQAGQLLCYLANHHALYIEGHAFKHEAPHLERAAQNKWPIQVEFAEDDPQHWPELEQTFEIRHLANAIDPGSRTFDFFIPLTNQSRGYEKEGRTFVVWRFRPGQRVRLHVPVEELKDVYVLPSAGIVREGPEAYVFRQNGDLFQRKPVHVLHEDRLNIVLAKRGSVAPGVYLARNGAASLNRVLKSQQAGGEPAGVHVHPDGTVHADH
jgi:cobalt-zinc-cadmium efflux system membrane fusion protein